MLLAISSSDIGKMLPIIFIILVAILLIVLAIMFVVKKKDNGKELESRKIKVLEKPIQQGNIEWYIVECDNGERLKLRNLNANNVIISVGDVGICEYRGQTIEHFKRQ